MTDRARPTASYTAQDYYRAGIRAQRAGVGLWACPAICAECADADWWRRGYQNALAGLCEDIDVSTAVGYVRKGAKPTATSKRWNMGA